MDSNVLACTYSLPGGGKTTDGIYSCADAVWILRNPAQVDPWEKVVGIEPADIRQVDDIVRATKVVRALKGNAPFFIVVDDISVLMFHYLTKVEPTYPREGDGVYRLWGHMADVTFDFQAACRDSGSHVLMTAHERSPDDALRGGPKVPSKNQTEKFCYEFTHILRVGTDPKRVGTWQGCYLCENNHPTWIMKDRDGVFAPKAPQNFAEHMRFAGREWPRPEGLEWMEDYVVQVAALIASGKKRKEVADLIEKALPDVDPLIRRWIRRDGFDRAEIKASYDARVAQV